MIMGKDKRLVGQPPITDARKLGIPKMLLLGLQHMFAMFGATVLVPLLTGPVSYTHLDVYKRQDAYDDGR